MATLREKIATERGARAMLEDHGLPQPDEVEYGDTCIRLLWKEEKVVMVVDVDEPPESFDLGGDEPSEPQEVPNDPDGRLSDPDGGRATPPGSRP